MGGLCGVAKPVQGTRQPYVSPLRAAGGRGLRARPIGDEWTFEEIDALLDDERVPLELKALLRISDAMLVESELAEAEIYRAASPSERRAVHRARKVEARRGEREGASSGDNPGVAARARKGEVKGLRV